MLKTAEQKAACEFLTPPQVAIELGVSHQKILDWIVSGELRAVDLSTGRRERPRYKIARPDLDAFLEKRATRPKPPAQPRRRPAPPTDGADYF